MTDFARLWEGSLFPRPHPDMLTAMVGAGVSRPGRAAVTGWVMYDLANSVFAISITAIYFPLWITKDLGGSDASLAGALSLATALAVVSSPLLGAWSDRVGKRMPFLVVTTLLSVGFTPLLGVRSIPIALGFFVVSSYFFQSGVVFYDALLPEVSTEQTRGRVGGLGVGLSSLGAFLAIGAGVLAPSIVGESNAKPFTFLITGFLFLIFAIPCFIFVKERRRERFTGGKAIQEAVIQLRETLGRAKSFPGVLKYLLGRAFYTNALNTLLLFFAIYVTEELGFTQRETEMMVLVGVLAPLVGGLHGGRLTDAWGPKRSLQLFLLLWFVAISILAALAYFEPVRALVWTGGSLSAFAFGGTFASDRPLLLRLTPPEYLGEFFGLHNMAGRFSAIVGPLLWTLVAEGMGLGRGVAMATLAAMLLFGYVFISSVPEASENNREERSDSDTQARTDRTGSVG